MRRFMLFDPETGRVTTGEPDLVSRWQDTNHLLWVDLSGESPTSERKFLTETFGIHVMAIQDAQRDRHPPKYEEFGEYYFLLLKGLSSTATDIDFETIQISMFVGRNFMVTRHSDESLSINALWESQTVAPDLLEKGIKALAPQLGRNIVNRYLNLLFQIETSLEELEQQLLSDDPDDDQLTQLAIYKTRLRKMSRTFTYHEQIFAFLRTHPMATDNGALTHEFNDTYEQLERVESLARLYYDLASDLIDSSISLASHRLNGIMKVLTIITAIFVPLSFLAGVYGMNFEFMPELGYKGAYYTLLSVMGVLALSLLAVFKIKRWI